MQKGAILLIAPFGSYNIIHPVSACPVYIIRLFIYIIL